MHFHASWDIIRTEQKLIFLIVLTLSQSYDISACNVMNHMSLFLWLALFDSAYKGKLEPNPSFGFVCMGDCTLIPPFPINPCAIKSQFIDLEGCGCLCMP